MEFATQDVELAKLAKLLSHPARVQILRHLSAQKDCLVGDLSAQLPLAPSTVSQHLRELRNGGLIQSRECGVKIYSCVNREALHRLEKLLTELSQACQCGPSC